MSPPAHRPRSPSPVRNTAAIPGSASKSSSAVASRRTMSSVRLLSAFGLFRRIWPSDPTLSTRTGDPPTPTSAAFIFVVPPFVHVPSFFSEERPRDDHAHDLIGALKDLMNAQVTHNLL